jgi:hypothetical protein
MPQFIVAYEHEIYIHGHKYLGYKLNEMNNKKYIILVAFASIIFLTGADGVLAGNAILWDSNILGGEPDGSNFRAFTESSAWANKANWKQVPYGTTSYTFVGDPIIDNGNFWLFVHSTGVNSPFLYGNVNGVPDDNAELYVDGFYANGDTTINEKADNFSIIKNDASEVIFQYDGSYRHGSTIVRLRVLANTNWVETYPVETGMDHYMFGLHMGNNKYAAGVPSDEASADLIIDGRNDADGYYEIRSTDKYIVQEAWSNNYKYTNYLLIPQNTASSNAYIRVHSESGYKALWELGNTVRLNGANSKTYFAVVNHEGTYRHQTITQTISSGQSISTGNNAPYAGKWRISGKVSGTYYTNTKTLNFNDAITFTAPVSGMLNDISYYLYDRTNSTASSVNTPMDIYRDITGDTQPSPTPTPTQPPLPSNPTNIENPGFESGTTPWLFHTNGTGTFTAAPPGFEGTNAAKITLSSSGTNIQLYQTGITLEPGTRYRLSFAAYSNTGHDLTVYLHKHLTPYTNYGLSYTAALSSTWQIFTTEFTTTGFSGTVNDERLRFWFASFAAAGDIYYIDDVRLEKVDISNNIYDLNNDGVVNVNDLEIVSLHFAENTVAPYPNYDVNAEGKVDILDITLVSNNII